jgi:Protein of unknown function (DUF3592)
MFLRLKYMSTILTIIGLIFATIAYRSWNATTKIIEGGLKTEGQVIDLVHQKDKQGQTTGKQAPVVQFKTQNGTDITYYSTTYSSRCPYAIGQVVPIWYMPDNPQEATLKAANAYSQPLIVIVCGMLAFLFLLPMLFKFFIRLIYQ